MKKLFFIILVVFNVKENLQAQDIKIGIEAGLGFANMHTESGVSTYYSRVSMDNYRNGVRLGIAFETKLGNKSNFQSGIFYSAKGSPKLNNGSRNISYNSCEIPFQYTFYPIKNSKIKLWLGGGAYIAFAVMAKKIYANAQSKVMIENANFGTVKYEDDLRRFEYGLQVQTGLNLINNLYVRLLVQRQLNNLAPNKFDPLITVVNVPLSSSNFETIRTELYSSITLGYFLNFKNKKH